MGSLLLVGVLCPAQERYVTWLTSYDAAIEEARKTGKPIFLEFRCAP